MGASGHSQGAGGAIQGYPTARMMYQLPDDNRSQGAFVNGTGEIFSQVPNSDLVASNIF
jgi:hypothetical protein